MTHRAPLLALACVCVATGVVLHPGDDIQAAVNSSPEGTQFTLLPGTYRLQSVVPKANQSFWGPASRQTVTAASLRESDAATRRLRAYVRPALRPLSPSPGDAAILSGALELSNATRDDQRDIWLVEGLQGLSSWQHGGCLSTHPACGFEQELFLDDARLLRTPSLSNVTKGARSWYLDYGSGSGPQTLYLSEDPTGAVLELSVVPSAFAGNVDGITIANLVVDKYASPAQRGAISAGCSAAATGGDGGGGGWVGGWLVTGVEVRNCHGRGMDVQYGAVATGCYAHDNGQLGFGGNNGTVSECEISFNNAAGFDVSWEAGGGKWFNTLGPGPLTVANSYVHDNAGDGLWTDGGSVHVAYTDNHLVDNAGAGISHEISYAAEVRGNVAMGNGKGFQVWLWDAQLQLQNSRDTVVSGNMVFVDAAGGSPNGIGVVSQWRGEGAPLAVNNSVVNNTIVFVSCGGHTGVVADANLTAVATGGNAFDWNTYYAFEAQQTAALYWWVGVNATGEGVDEQLSYAQLQGAAGQERHGVLIPGDDDCSSMR